MPKRHCFQKRRRFVPAKLLKSNRYETPLRPNCFHMFSSIWHCPVFTDGSPCHEKMTGGKGEGATISCGSDIYAGESVSYGSFFYLCQVFENGMQ